MGASVAIQATDLIIACGSCCSEEFYDRHGHERRYFYYIDLQVRPLCWSVCVYDLFPTDPWLLLLLALGPTVSREHAAEEHRDVSEKRQVPALLLLASASEWP